MNSDHLNARGLVLLGCGKMGSAMLKGWLAQGVGAASVTVIDPCPSDWLKDLASRGLRLNTDLPAAPLICVIAVKPQMMTDALPQLAALGGGATVFLSIAAGTRLGALEALLGAKTPIVRAMPNTPAAVGRGITALIENGAATEADMSLAQSLMATVGQTVRLNDEAQMDAVTAVSGSGPAYVFHLIEALAAAGERQGLEAGLSLKLARATVAGAGDLAEQSNETPTGLRVNVTSPGGTTAAALEVLMDEETGFCALVERAVSAAALRSRELGGS